MKRKQRLPYLSFFLDAIKLSELKEPGLLVQSQQQTHKHLCRPATGEGQKTIVCKCGLHTWAGVQLLPCRLKIPPFCFVLLESHLCYKLVNSSQLLIIKSTIHIYYPTLSRGMKKNVLGKIIPVVTGRYWIPTGQIMPSDTNTWVSLKVICNILPLIILV